MCKYDTIIVRMRIVGVTLEISVFQPPSTRAMHLLTALPRAWFQPCFIGLDRIDLSKPALWVGNHTLYGLQDVPLLMERLLQEGVMLRGLGDRGHFKVPLWGKALVRAGMVMASPEHCAGLMASGQHILVFPGGGREVMRRKGEAYRLIWKRRTGFARLAIEHGYDILPFASLGPDETLDILLDADDIMASRPWRCLNRRWPLAAMTRDGDMIPPVVKGLGPTCLPRPQRFYFGFGQRISTAEGQVLAQGEDLLWQLRQRVAASIEAQMELLQRVRAEDQPRWSRWRRYLTRQEGSSAR